jgi:hypothetical protein
MPDYRYVVTISAPGPEQADAVMDALCALQRIETDLDTFAYEATWVQIIGWEPTPAP